MSEHEVGTSDKHDHEQDCGGENDQSLDSSINTTRKSESSTRCRANGRVLDIFFQVTGVQKPSCLAVFRLFDIMWKISHLVQSVLRQCCHDGKAPGSAGSPATESRSKQWYILLDPFRIRRGTTTRHFLMICLSSLSGR